jgi:DNA polymerase-4
MPPLPRRILHLDVDAFLASVEEVLHPELRGKPLVIGGLPGERNLVMSCSYAARAFGVRPGMPLGEAARRCPQAIFRRGDSQAANRLRERTALVVRRFTPLVEVTSIDDLFADLGGCARLSGTAFETAVALRAAIAGEIGLPVTIGIATSRTLARLAGKLAKPGGVAEIRPGYEADFLTHLPVEHLPGVGHTIRAALERFAIRTVGELRLVSREVLFASFGRPGLLIHERARGLDDEPVEPTWVEDPDGRLRPRAPKSIRRDSTFEPEEGRRAIVEAMLSYVVERASARLRACGHAAGSLAVRVQYVDTRPRIERAADPEGHGSAERRRALSAPTDATDRLWSHARALFAELPRRRALVKRVGITLCRLAPSAGWQGELYSPPLDPGDHHGPRGSPLGLAGAGAGAARDEHATSRDDRHRRLDRALDRLRARHGFGGVLRGASFPLIATHPLSRDGFQLRTPSLNQ